MPKVATSSRPVIRWTYRSQNYSYPVSDEDFLWWARAIWREGKPQITVGHTLLQRFTYLYSTSGVYKTLSEFLQAYCQPINPLWFPGGVKSEARIKRLKAAGDAAGVEAEQARAEQRVKYATTPLSKIPKKYRLLAEQILKGETVNPVPRAIHFTSSFASKGDSSTIARQKAVNFAKSRNLEVVNIPEGFSQGVNWFFKLPATNPPRIEFGFVKLAALPIGLVGLIIVLLLFGRKKREL